MPQQHVDADLLADQQAKILGSEGGDWLTAQLVNDADQAGRVGRRFTPRVLLDLFQREGATVWLAGLGHE